MSLKPGDIVRLNAVWGRADDAGVGDGEREGDICIIIERAGSDQYPVWSVIHGRSGRLTVFHEDYFDRVE